MITTIIGVTIVTVSFLTFVSGIRIVRPTEKALVERLGKYHHFASPGFNWIIPIIDSMIKVNVTEMMAGAEPQEIITSDKLNAVVDAQIYYKVKDDEESVKASQYNVYNYENQIIQLARTTLRNIIGTMNLSDANSKRNVINDALMGTLTKETKNWGISVVRTELKEINPPQDVQETMNRVVKAENEKTAAVDFATATETVADGERRASIKKAEGQKQSEILKAEGQKTAQVLVAEGQAKAFDLINKSFVDNAQTLKRLEVTQACMENNSKIILSKDGINPQLIIGDVPIFQTAKKTKGSE